VIEIEEKAENDVEIQQEINMVSSNQTTFYVTSKFRGKNTLDDLIKRLIQTDVEGGLLAPKE